MLNLPAIFPNPVTPSSINDAVKKLQIKIGTGGVPIFVPVKNTRGYLIDDCYMNVEKHIKKFGGGIKYGWTVWELLGKFIEGEFHAVWVSPEGEMIDITPHADGEKEILFIPDVKRIYNNEPVDNVRLALCDDPAVHRMIRSCEAMTRLRTKYNDGTGVAKIPVDELISAPQPIKNAPKIGRNNPCPCNSGKKFKHCCGKLS